VIFSAARISTAVLLAAVLCLAGCRSRQPAAPSAGPETGARTYNVRGVVVSANATTGEVILNSEAIPGYMPAMTMPYTLKQPSVATELHLGDTITAVMEPTAQADLLDQIDIVDQARPDYVPKVTYNTLEPGETIPDFRFLNQSGRMIRLRGFRGKVVLMTFIYTRCPLPNYCVRMSRNFAKIDKALQKDPKLYARTHLLSISFDPEYDTPKVLRSYGGAYTGRYTEETFTHWDFAAPPEDELKKVLLFFDIGITPVGSQTITHSLSTVVIAPDGKLYKWYPGNEWTSEQVLADVEHLEAGRG
jgi:protein SCO1/2